MESPSNGEVGSIGAAAAGAGAAGTATLAVACCVPVVSPLLVSVLGVGGAIWVAGLRPYSPYILGATLLVLAYGFRAVYRRRPVCQPDQRAGRAHRLLARIAVITLWLSAVVWIAAATTYLLLA